MEDDILLVDKPKGITSFDVIRRLRKELNIKKMGHAGTLDPLASGLMIIGINTGTKKLTNYIKLDKTYEAEVVIGEQRTTGDMEGEIVAESDASGVTREEVEQTLAGMVGVLALPVPVYSAIKKDGQPLYKKARKGQDVETPVKDMHVQHAELTRTETNGERVHAHIIFDVGSGTYIRSLAEELGRRLGHPATLGNLRRTRVGEFKIEDARTV